MTFAPGDRLTAARLNSARVKVYAGAAIATTSGTLGVIGFSAEAYESVSTMHSTSTNTSRLVAPNTGLYTITAGANWAISAAGRRVLLVRKNAAGVGTGGTQLATLQGAPSLADVTAQNLAIEVQLAAGDYVELFALQTSGVTLNLGAGEDSTYFTLRQVA